jgi:predicted glycoside hydrolase/deacetylase ChbG (UPF0249 family)
MQPNPALKKLGFSNDDRVVIIHTDDIGMCQASVSAFADLFNFGLISSGAVMVPCPWFLEVAAFCRSNPEVDMGVHLTLTSEWENYRWGPVSTIDPASGMIDEQGYFHRLSEQVQEHADPEAAQREMETQVQRALNAGIQPTHFDTHMGAVASPKFIPGYMQLAYKHTLPPMLFRYDEAAWQQEVGLDTETTKLAAQFVLQLEEAGLPLLDHLDRLHLDEPEARLERTKQAFSNFKPGITHFIIHPSKDTPELRAITPDWTSRVLDYEIFMSQEMGDHIQDIGVHVIGYQALKDLMPDTHL